MSSELRMNVWNILIRFIKLKIMTKFIYKIGCNIRYNLTQ